MTRHVDDKQSPYTISEERYGRTEYRIDVQRFAKDIAAQLGGTIIPENPDAYDAKTSASFTMPEQLKIHVWHNYSHKGAQVGLSIAPTDVPQDLWSSMYGDKYKLPSITVSTDRPLSALAKDITRRLIEACASPVRERRAYAKQQQEHKDSLGVAVAALKKAFPALDLRVNDKGTEATFYSSKPYMQGRVYVDGSVGIDRLGTISPEAFAKVMRLLSGEG